MNYFKNNNNEVYAYDDEQVKQGYGKDLTPILEDEMLAITNPPKTEEQLNREKISEAKHYLESTDWIIVKINETQVLGNDIQPLLEKYTVELAKRLEARDTINTLQQ